MACISGTNIVNDGLVFHFDLENGVKSFKGKPTSNLVTNTPTMNGWAGSYTVIDSDTKTFNIQTTQNNATTTAAWRTWYWDVSAYVGQTVTISGDVEFVSETNATFLHITIGQGNTGSFPYHIAGSSPEDRVQISTKPIEKIKMYWTGIINSTGVVGFTQWITNVTADGGNAVLQISNVQIEINDFPTKFVNGVRLDTASIIDLSPNKNTITAANLTYRQDDTPTFDGTDDFLSTGTPNITSTSFTLNSWVKLYSLNRYNPIIGDYQYDWFGLYFDSSNNIVSMHRKGTGQDNRLSYATNSFINTNTWYHITSVFDINVGKSLFINGEQVATNTNIYDFTLAAPRGPQYIGRHARGAPGSPEYMNGEISQVKIYDKALTEAEVKQNFEATRTRYGI